MESAYTILLVDDDLTIRKEIAKVLMEWGYAVDEAADYQETMDQVNKHDYDLVLLDLRIPDRNSSMLGAKGGFEALEDTRRTKPSLPVIVFSDAYDVVENVVVSIRMGAYDFLSKKELLGRAGRCPNIIADAVQGLSAPMSQSWPHGRVERRINGLRKQIDILDNRIYGIEVELAKGGLDPTRKLRLGDELAELKRRLEEIEGGEEELRERLQNGNQQSQGGQSARIV